jgi:hypothetical protein
MAGIKSSDLVSGGPYRWVVRGVVLSSLVLVLLLTLAFDVHVIIAALIGFTVLLVELGVVWVLLVKGKIQVKL